MHVETPLGARHCAEHPVMPFHPPTSLGEGRREGWVLISSVAFYK